MTELKIVEIDINDLTPYSKNAKKHSKKQVEQIANSMKDFGMCDPIGIWGENNIIVEGHGRLEAAKKLGMQKVPCIRLDHLTEEQRRAYTLTHNKAAEGSDWDYSILDSEIEDLIDFNFEDYGFEFDVAEEPEAAPQKKKNERLRTDYAYNLPYVDLSRCEGKYQMPIIENDGTFPTRL